MSLASRRVLTASALTLAVGVSLVGCDASTSEPNPAAGTTLTVTPSLGVVRNAAIVVRNAAGRQVGTGSTDNSGVATVHAQGSGPFVVEVQGGGSAQYFDENLRTFVAFPAGQRIRALVPAGATNVGVTGLTEVAAALWSASGQPLSGTNVNAANNAIRAAMASALPDLLIPPTPVGATPAANSLTDTAADLYATILAGLADAGAGAAGGLPPALAVIDQLRRDVQDGDIDGHDDTGAFTTLYNAAGFATQFQSFIDTRRSSWGNAAQQATTFNLVALVEPSWNGGGNTGGGGSTVPATVHAGIAGSYSLVFTKGQGVTETLPFTDGSTYPATVSSSGQLVVNGVSYNAPYHRIVNNFTIDTEVNWNSGLGFEFALSDNAGGNFNEINLYSTTATGPGGFPKFLGQLHEPAAGPDLTALTALAGDHALVVTEPSGTLSRVPSAFQAGQDVTLSVSAGGSVSSTRLSDTFDPAAAGTTYRNFLTGSIEPRLEIERKDDRGTSDTGDDITYTLSLYLENGVLLGARYVESAPCGFSSGCWTTASVMLEARPLPAAQQSFISTLAAANVQEVTVIQHSTNATLPALCTAVPFAVTTGTQPQQAPVTFTINNYAQAWSARYSRLSDAPTTGNPMMRFLLMSVENMGGGLIRVREHSASSIAAIATNDPAQISAAGCSTGGSGELNSTLSGAIYTGTTKIMDVPTQQEVVSGDIDGITEFVLYTSITRDHPTATNIDVVLNASSTATHKVFDVTYDDVQPPFGAVRYVMTWDYEVR